MQLLSQISFAALFLSVVAAVNSEVRRLPGGTATQVAELSGVPKWHLFPHLWSRNNVDISCPDRQVHFWCWQVEICITDQVFMQEFEVFVAQDTASLHEKIIAGDTAWCGLERLISGHRKTCSISVTPFQTTYVGIVPNHGHDVFTQGTCTPKPTLCSMFPQGMMLKCCLCNLFSTSRQHAYSSCMLIWLCTEPVGRY